MSHPYAEHRSEHVARANRTIRHAGYKHGGSVSDDASDKRIAASAVHAHERHDHKGEPLTKLRSGGHVEGEASGANLAKRARGGHLGKKGHSTKVNIVIAPQGHEGGMQPAGLPVAAPHPAMPAPRPPMPARPPMAGGMPMRPPMAGAPMAGGMPLRKRGGAVKMDAGAGGGEGRIEKADEYGSGGFKPKKGS